METRRQEDVGAKGLRPAGEMGRELIEGWKTSKTISYR